MDWALLRWYACWGGIPSALGESAGHESGERLGIVGCLVDRCEIRILVVIPRQLRSRRERRKPNQAQRRVAAQPKLQYWLSRGLVTGSILRCWVRLVQAETFHRETIRRTCIARELDSANIAALECRSQLEKLEESQLMAEALGWFVREYRRLEESA